MERMKNIAGKIYTLRYWNKLSQEQLAQILSVSPAEVAKWERNLKTPDLEALCALADHFQISMDELLGRPEKLPGNGKPEGIGSYSKEKTRMSILAKDLIRCCEISRKRGLLAMEDSMEPWEGSGFLSFAIKFILDGMMRQMEMPLIFSLLGNYAKALPGEWRREGEMIVDVMRLIISGESEEIVKETAASYVGMEYREEITQFDFDRKTVERGILDKYADKPLYSKNTDLLEKLADLDDLRIQSILNNTDNEVFTAAMKGASGKVVSRFFANLAPRMMYSLNEDMDLWSGTEEEIIAAQKQILETWAGLAGC